MNAYDVVDEIGCAEIAVQRLLGIVAAIVRTNDVKILRQNRGQIFEETIVLSPSGKQHKRARI